VKWLVAVLLVGLALGWGATTNMPVAAGIAVIAMGLIWIGPVSLRRISTTLTLSFLIVLIAATDFRTRDPYESVRVAVDFEVAFELGVYFLLFLVVLRAIFVIPRESAPFRPVEWMLAAYLALACVSIAWSPVMLYSATRAVQLATLLLLAYACVRLLGPEVTLRSLAACVIFYVVVCTLIAAPSRWGDWVSGAERLAWFAVHPIQAGTFAATGALLLITESLFGDRRRSYATLKGVLLGFLVVVVVMTHSRGPLLAFAVTSASLLLVRYAPTVAATAAVSLFVLLTLVAYNAASGLGGLLDLAAASHNPVLSYLFRGQSAEEFATMTGRLELWEAMSVAFWQRPVLGYGYQAARVVGMAILPWAGEAHNALAQSLLDLGLVGTALLFLAALRTLSGSYIAVARSQSRYTLYHAAVFGLTLYLLVNSVIAASFAGPPGYEPLVLFVCIMGGEQLRILDRRRGDIW